MGFDAMALRGGLDAWRDEVGNAAPPRPSKPPESVIQGA
jgi:hypothetical protein